MPLKIQYCSDLHLEFFENSYLINQSPLKPKGDILILAGDIVPFAHMEDHDDFFDYVSAKFKFVYWIPGNHEYYGFDSAKKCGIINEKIRNNVFLLNNVTIVHDSIRFIFSTLWSKISPVNEVPIMKGMNDFYMIKYKKDPLTATQYNKFHNESIHFIKEEIKKPHKGKTIVVTHHVPTFMNYPEKYKGSSINEGFATELFDLIESSKINYWIYGHHHQNVESFSIGKTKLLTNQLGYVKYGEHMFFDNALLVK